MVALLVMISLTTTGLVIVGDAQWRQCIIVLSAGYFFLLLTQIIANPDKELFGTTFYCWCFSFVALNFVKAILGTTKNGRRF